MRVAFKFIVLSSTALSSIPGFASDARDDDGGISGLRISSAQSVIVDRSDDSSDAEASIAAADPWVLKNHDGYTKERLIKAWNWMVSSGAINKFVNKEENAFRINVSTLLGEFKEYPEERLNFVCEWMKKTGVWDTCSNGVLIKGFLEVLKEYPDFQLEFVREWLEKTDVHDDHTDGPWDIVSLLETLKAYPDPQLKIICFWMRESGLWRKFGIAVNVSCIFKSMQGYEPTVLQRIFSCVQEYGLLEQCESGQDLDLLLRLRKIPGDRLDFISQWLKKTGVLSKFPGRDKLKRFIEKLVNTTDAKLNFILEWHEQNGVFKKFIDGDSISLFVNTVTDYPEERLDYVRNWLNKCVVRENFSNGEVILELLSLLEGYSEQRLHFVCTWLEDPSVIKKCGDGKWICRILEYFDSCELDFLKSACFWMKASGALDKCIDGEQIYRLIKGLRRNQLPANCSWLQESDALDKCMDGEEVRLFVEGPHNYAESTAVSWMKESGVWDQCQSGRELISFLEDFRDTFKPWEWLDPRKLLESGVLGKCKNVEEIKSLTRTLCTLGNVDLDYLYTWLKETGVLDMCKDGKDVKFCLRSFEHHTSHTFNASNNIRSLCERMSASGVLGKCATVDDVNTALALVKQWVEVLDIGIESLKKEGVWDKCKNVSQIESILGYSPLSWDGEHFTHICTWMKETGIWDKCKDGADIEKIISLFWDGFPDYIKPLGVWLQKSGALEKCQEVAHVLKIIKSLKHYSTSDLDLDGNNDSIPSWLVTSGSLEKCESGEELGELIGCLVHQWAPELVLAHLSFLEQSGALSKCKNGKETVEIIQGLPHTYKRDILDTVFAVIKEYGMWDKCQDGTELTRMITYCFNFVAMSVNHYNGSLFYNTSSNYFRRPSVLLDGVEVLTEIRLRQGFQRLQTIGAIAKCENGPEVEGFIDLMFSHKAFDSCYAALKAAGVWDRYQKASELLNPMWTLLREPVAILRVANLGREERELLDKCKDVEDLDRFVETVTEISQKSLESGIIWAKKMGIWDRCEEYKQIDKILYFIIKDADESELELIYEWLLGSGNLEKKADADWFLTLFECLFGDKLEDAEFISRKGSDFLNMEFFTLYLRFVEPKNPSWYSPVVNSSVQLERFVADMDFYLLFHIYYQYNPAVEAELSKAIEDPNTRENTLLNLLISCLGEGHPFVQKYMHLALGYDNQTNPDGFLSVHREMVKKSLEDATEFHKGRVEKVGLNLESIMEPRPAAPLPLSVTVWHGLFDQLKNVMKEDPQRYENISDGISWDGLILLKKDPMVESLLDPENVSLPSENVSSDSQKLREVVHNIVETQNLDAFLQLLMNMQSCSTGKLNGITQSHILLARGILVDERQLGGQRFKDDLISFLKEEFRRFREGILTSVVTEMGCDPVDPHNLYYVRGILGHDIGVLFGDESVSIDLNANCVSDCMREKSKRDLLSSFYKYFTADQLTKRFQGMLNHSLTVSIINTFFKEEAMNEDLLTYNPKVVVVNKEGNPVSLTTEASKQLLVTLGFLCKAGA